jgi:TrmH family RNA methyltransferase
MVSSATDPTTIRDMLFPRWRSLRGPTRRRKYFTTRALSSGVSELRLAASLHFAARVDIHSGMNATRRQLAMLRSLRTRKGRDETGLFLVEGLRLCSELIPAKARVEIALLAEGPNKSGAPEKLETQAAQLASTGTEVLRAPARDFERISDTVTSQGILAAVRWEDVAPEELRFPGNRAVVLALDGVSDPGNVGTVVRTGAWFGVSALLLGEGCADLLNPKTVRATMGGIFQLPICRGVKLSHETGRLKQLGFRVTAATMDGSPDWSSWAKNPRSALILGGEARGVSEELLPMADQRIAIPRRGAGESLNVAVSAGIFLSALK